MRRAELWAVTALAMLPATAAVAQQKPDATTVVGYVSSVGAREASIDLQLANGKTTTVALKGGQVLLNGAVVGTYAKGGALEQSFRTLLQKSSALSSADMLAALKQWQPSGLAPKGQAARLLITQRLAPLSAVPGAPTPAPDAPPAPPAPPAVAPALAPSAPGAPTPVPDILDNPAIAAQLARANAIVRQIDIPVRTPPPVSAWASIGNGIASLLGAFAALAAMGFGATFFAPRQLEVVADTATKSFGRSFLTGLFAQPLVPVTFGLAMAGLALTIIGILALPVAAVLAIALLATAGVGGYLAVARAAGELYLRRRMARGEYSGRVSIYRFLLYGIAALLAIWIPAVLFGWVPVMGPLFVWLAAACTWGAATVGFGAVILSRGGVLGTFGRPSELELTDEHLWSAGSALAVRRAPPKSLR